MKPAIEWGHAVDEAVAEDIQRDVLDAAAHECERYAKLLYKLTPAYCKGQVDAAMTLASLLRGMKP